MSTPPARLATPAAAPPARAARLRAFGASCVRLLEAIPHSLIAALGRFSIAAVFWNSGQTKVEGFALDFVRGEFRLGWPRLSETAVALFQDEYKLPWIAPAIAAGLAAVAEHVFPLLLLLGLGTRLAALALLGMTLVIQLLVYPGAYATHGTWAAVLLYLVARGPGWLSIDHWLASRRPGPEHLQGQRRP